MEGLIFLLIVIFLIANSNSKKKKTRQAAKNLPPSQLSEAQVQLMAAQARAAEKASQPPAGKLSPEERAERIRQLKEKQRARRQASAETAPEPHAAPAPAPVIQGASALDDEGCLGGSLPHDHTEGESRAEHAAHMAAMRARDAAEAAVAEPRGLADFDPRDLRRAVVISEILGKPKALRRRA